MNATTTPNIFPVLRYADAPAAIDFLERAFGLARREVFPDGQGGVAHAELDLGADVIGISSARGPAPGNPWTTVNQGVYVAVHDIDAHHQRAEAAGAEIVRPLVSTDYGAREYTVRDGEGHLWGFGTYTMGASPGQSLVFPGIYYRDGAKAVEWLQRVAGFELTLQLDEPAAGVVHAELGLPPGIVMVSSGPQSGGLWGDRVQCIHVVEADPDAHAARAAAAGAAIVRAPEDTSYGSRAYYTRDCEGFLWGFSTYRPADRPSPRV